MNALKNTEPLLWITGPTTPTTQQKRTCITLVTALAQDGWSISATETTAIGSLAARSTRAMGGNFESTPVHSPVHRNTLTGVRMVLPRRVWDAERAGLCAVTTGRARGRVIIRIDLTPAVTDGVSTAPRMMGRQHSGVER